MLKARKSITLIAGLIIILITSIATYFSLVATGEITPVRPELIIQIEDSEKVYDGTPNNPTYHIQEGEDKLDLGSTIKLDYINLDANVGNKPVSATAHVYDKFKNDITKDFDIKVLDGMSKITPMSLKIKINGKSKVYDSLPIGSEDYELVEGSLARGEKIIPSFKNVATNAGDEVKAEMTAEIIDSNGKATTGNYAITYDNKEADLVIKKRPFLLIGLQAEKEYDGKELQSYMVDGLLKGDKFILLQGPSILNAGSIINDYSKAVYQILDKDNKDVTANYQAMSQAVGRLKIYPKEIHIELNDLTFEYDATDKNELILNDDKLSELISVKNKEYLADLNLKAKINKKIDIVDAKKYKYTPEIVAVDDKDNVNENIVFTCKEIDVEVTKKAATITGVKVDTIYDGEAHSIENDSFTALGFLEEHLVTIEYLATGNFINAGEYKSEIDTVKVVDRNNVIVTDNYDITKINGEVIITPKPIDVYAEDIEKVYSGSEIKSEIKTGNIKNNDTVGLIENATITAKYTIDSFGIVVSADNYVNEIESVEILNGEEDVTLNYNPTFYPGIIKITPKKVLDVDGLEINDLIYNGTLSYESNVNIDLKDDLNNKAFIEGGIIVVNQEFGDTTYSIDERDSIVVLDSKDNDISNCYDFSGVTIINGSCKINKRLINIVGHKFEDVGYFEYKNKTPEEYFADFNDLYEKDDALISGHNLKITYSLPEGVVINEIKQYETASVVKIMKDTLDVSSYYDIKFVNNPLNVTANEITVKANDLNEEFTGKVIKADVKNELNPSYTIVAGELGLDHKLEVFYTKDSYGIDAGIYVNEISKVRITWEHENDLGDVIAEDVTSYYKVNLKHGFITINPKKITLVANMESIEYIGLNNTSLPNGFFKEDTLLDGERFVINGNASFIDTFGSTRFTLDQELVKVYNGDIDKTSNYDITLESEYNINIIPRNITIETPTFNDITYAKEYDLSSYDNEPFKGTNLLENHELSLNYTLGYKDKIGSYDVAVSGMEIGYTGLEHFNITFTNNKINIVPIEITQKNPDLGLVYEHDQTIDMSVLTTQFIDGNVLTDFNYNLKLDYDNLDAGEHTGKLFVVDSTGNTTENMVITNSSYQFSVAKKELFVDRTEDAALIPFKGREISHAVWYQIPQELLDLEYTVVINPKEDVTLEGIVDAMKLNQGFAVSVGSYTITDKNGNSLEHNYLLKSQDSSFGEIKFDDLVIEVEFLDPIHKTYDKQALDSKVNNYINCKLNNKYITRDDIVFSYTGDPISNAGSYSFTPDYIIKYDGVDLFNLDENVQIVTLSFGEGMAEIVIDKKEVSITTPSVSYVYGSEVPEEEIQDIKKSIEIEVSQVDTILALQSANAGSYTNKCSLVEDEINYAVTYNFGTITILPKDVYVAIPSFTTTYGELFDPKAQAEWTAIDAIEGIVIEANVINIDTPAGMYSTVKSIVPESDNYKLHVTPGYITVLKKDEVFYAPTASIEYGTNYMLSNDGWYDPAIVEIYSNEELTSTPNVGSYKTIKGYNVLSPNHNVKVMNGIVEVYPKQVTLTATGEDFVYGNMYHVPDETSLICSEEGVSLSYTVDFADLNGMNAGAYDVVADFKDIDSNYDITLVNKAINIKQRPVTLTATGEDLVYGDTYYMPTEDSLTCSEEGVSLSFTIDFADLNGQNAGAYDVVADFKDTDDNYDITLVNKAINIKQRPVTLKALPYEITYGDYYNVPDKSSLQNYQPSFNINITFTNATGLNAGKYNTVSSFEDIDSNYDITLENNLITVLERKVELRAPYGFIFSYRDTHEFNSFDLINNSGQYLFKIEFNNVAPTTNIGTYNVVKSFEDTDPNYEITLINNTYKVNPLDVTITAQPTMNEFTYGASYEFSSNDLSFNPSNEMLDYEITFNQLSTTTGVGTYNVVNTIKNNNLNYNIILVNATYKVLPMEVTLSAPTGITYVYGTTERAFSLNDLEGYTLDLTLDVLFNDITPETEAGIYNVVESFVNLDSNYIVRLINAKYEITPEVVNLTAQSQTITYGDLLVLDKMGIEGYDPKYKIDIKFADITSAKEYETIASITDNDKNYDFVLTNGTITVLKKQITITATSATVNQNALFDQSFITDNKDAIVGYELCTTDKLGEFDTVKWIIFNENYDVTFINGTITVQ